MEKTFRVTRTPVHEQVRDHLQSLIRNGGLAPGDALPPERDLALELGVSRHSLRQAIASLEALGVVETRHGSGVYLTSRPSDEAVARVADALFNETRTMADAIEARLAFEPYIARLAAERRSDDEIDLLVHSIDVPPQNSGQRGVVREALTFHHQLASMTGNPIFEGLLRSVTTGPRNITELSRQRADTPDRWRTEHVEICQAVEARDSDRAARLMTAHLEEVMALAMAMDTKTKKTASKKRGRRMT